MPSFKEIHFISLFERVAFVHERQTVIFLGIIMVVLLGFVLVLNLLSILAHLFSPQPGKKSEKETEHAFKYSGGSLCPFL